MAICYEVFAIIVGDLSNENIHDFQNNLHKQDSLFLINKIQHKLLNL